MALRDKEKCSGPTGCGHPRHQHTGTHIEGSRTACRQPLAQGRAKCPCRAFKEVRDGSSDSEEKVEGAESR